MSTEFEELENEIMAEMKQVYSNTVTDHAMNPRNAGSISDADGFGSITGPCGDTIEIWLKIKDGKISNASFWTDGCGATIACSSIATERIKGSNIPQALAVNQSDIIKALEGLPEDNHHCALLTANTIKTAIQDYLALRKEPWKKAYRR